MKLSDINKFSSNETTDTMPVLFIGHGSPMNGIENNLYSEKWHEIGQKIAKPTSVLCISAHWLTHGTYVTAMPNPRTIHDFGGFPKALYDVQYPAPGNSRLALETKETIKKTEIGLDHEWGLDHGTWTVVRHMYPNADIPVLQLSIDYHKPARYHFELAQELAYLRKKGVLIIGSGNIVHNLRMVAWERLNDVSFGFEWALEFNEKVKTAIDERNYNSLINYENMGDAAKLSVPTPDHYFPLLYSLALCGKYDPINFFNDNAVAGSLTMTSLQIG